MSGAIVTNLPDDEEPLPRRKPAIDEVHEAHAAAGEYLPPLSATSHLSGGDIPAPATNTIGSSPLSSTTNTFASPMSSPMNTGMGTPINSVMGAPMNTGMGTPINTGMGAPLGSPLASPLGGPIGGTLPGAIPPTTSIIDNSGTATMGAAMMNQQTMQMNTVASTAQAQASVGLAQASLDKELLEDQLKKEDEHWVKSYWRPAMGWLYMIICFMDFVGFPLLTMFLPVIERGFGITVGYTPWQSLTLSNGGLIHLAFGGILGVAAFSRGQEKLAAMK